MSNRLSDEYYMSEAIYLAEAAACLGEVPVGAVVVIDGQIIGRGFNSPIGDHDMTAHAEIIALRNAALFLQNYRLPECSMYVTLEPCLMCAGAIFNARIKHLYFGAFDYKSGVAGSVLNLFSEQKLNHHCQVTGGILADECREELQSFFRERRIEKTLKSPQQISSLQIELLADLYE